MEIRYGRSHPFSVEAVEPVPVSLRTFPITGIFAFVLFHRGILGANTAVKMQSYQFGRAIVPVQPCRRASAVVPVQSCRRASAAVIVQRKRYRGKM